MNIERYLKKYKLNIVLGILSIFVSFYVLFNTQPGSGYDNYFVIPGIFGILLLLCGTLNFSNVENIGPLILNYTMVIKYAICPLISCLGNYSSWLGVYPSINEIKYAIRLTAVEMISIVVLSVVLSNKYMKKEMYTGGICNTLRGKWFHYIIIIVGLVVFFAVPSAFLDYRFIFNSNNLGTTIKVSFAGSGIFKTLFTFARYSLVLVIIDFFYKRNQKKDSVFNVIGALIPTLLNCLFVSNLSRIGIFAPLLACCFLIMMVFRTKKARKTVFIAISTLGLAFIVLLSFMKFFGEGRGSVSNASNIFWWGDTLNMYFTGVKETANGVRALGLIRDTYGRITLPLMWNDSFSNVSLLSNLTDNSINSNVLYNIAYFGSRISISQICPNICEGLYYFGPIFAFVWPCIFVWLTYRFSYRSHSARFLDSKFLYIYAAIYCGMVLMINSAMIICNIINISLLYALVAFINKKFRVGR